VKESGPQENLLFSRQRCSYSLWFSVQEILKTIGENPTCSGEKKKIYLVGGTPPPLKPKCFFSLPKGKSFQDVEARGRKNVALLALGGRERRLWKERKEGPLPAMPKSLCERKRRAKEGRPTRSEEPEQRKKASMHQEHTK